MLHESVKKSIETNNMKLLKYTFCDCLDGDPTFKLYEEDYDYCVKHNILFEAHREINPMTLNNVSEEYWVQLKNDFLENPSTKRLNHMREVAKILYKDRIAAIEEQKRKEYEAAEKAKKAEAEKARREAEEAEMARREAERTRREAEDAKRFQNNTVSGSSSVNTNGDGIRRETKRSQYQGNHNTNSAGTPPKKSSGMGLKLLILAIVIVGLIILVKSCTN